MGNSFFITGCGTGIGKTVVTCSLIKQLKESGRGVMALKPLISGWEEDINTNDTMQVLHSLQLSPSQENIEKISPWRFKAPLAASMAAREEERIIDYPAIVTFCKQSINKYDYLLIEGAGGVMSPLSDNKTGLDLISDLSIPAILVTGSYLGAISHTLTSIKSMESAGVKIRAIIVNESENGISLADTISELRNFTGHKIVQLRRAQVTSDFIWHKTEDILPCLNL